MFLLNLYVGFSMEPLQRGSCGQVIDLFRYLNVPPGGSDPHIFNQDIPWAS